MILRLLFIFRIIGFFILLALSVLVWRVSADRGSALIFLALVWTTFWFGIYRFSVLMRRLLERGR